MNWHATLNSIYVKLKTYGFAETSDELFQAQLSGGTGGEIFSAVVDKLIHYKKNNPDVYAVIKDETEAMIAFGRSINYLK